MTEKMLISKLVVSDTMTRKRVARLFSSNSRLRLPSLTLFDLAMLADVGIDPNALQKGQEIRKRFWAHWQLSQKETQRGNQYRDVIALEPFGDETSPQPPTDLDPVLDLIQDALDELQEIHAKLDRLLARSEPDQSTEAPGFAAAKAELEPAPEPDPSSVIDTLDAANPELPPAPSADQLPCGQRGAMQVFYQLAGPALAAGTISYQRASELANSANNHGWVGALATLQARLAGN